MSEFTFPSQANLTTVEFRSDMAKTANKLTINTASQPHKSGRDIPPKPHADIPD